jgi:putative ABC transport system permease protein
VIAMIALPVFGAVGADVVYRSAQLTPAEQSTRLMGQADALVSLFGRGFAVLQAPDPADGVTGQGPVPGQAVSDEQRRSLAETPQTLLQELLPSGSVLTPVVTGPAVDTSTVAGQTHTGTAQADLSDPVWRGKIDILAGRAPSSAREVAATRYFLDQSGLHIGDTTTVRGISADAVTITAAVEYPGALKTAQLISAPGGLVTDLFAAQAAQGLTKGSAGEPGETWLVRLPEHASPIDWGQVQKLDEYGFATTSRSVLLTPPAPALVPFDAQRTAGGAAKVAADSRAMVAVTVVAMALLETILLAGAAFAVGARRSRRQLGLVAAAGGERRHIRALVLSGGLVLGAAGAGVGAVAGIALAALTRPWAEQLAGTRFGQLTVRPAEIAALALLGVLAGVLAAIVPAVQAARLSVVSALSQTTSVRRANRKVAVLALVLVLLGTALALLGVASGIGSPTADVAIGSVIAELGMVAVTPILVGWFGRLGPLLPLGARLALRDAVRHRGRTAPAVAAVMAAVAGAVAVFVYQASADEENRRAYVASAPTGAVLLSAGWGPASDWQHLGAERQAVEASLPGLGSRGDVYAVTYHGDCRTADGACGTVTIQLPSGQPCGPAGAVPPSPAGSATPVNPRCSISLGTDGAFGDVTAGDSSVLRNLFGVSDASAAQALARGRAIVFDPRYLHNGMVTLRLPVSATSSSSEAGTVSMAKELSIPATVASSPAPVAQALINPRTARALGLTVEDLGSAWLPDATPSVAAEQRAAAAVAALGTSSLSVERGYQPTQGLVAAGLMAFAALVTIGSAWIATGLAAADSARDLMTLAAVGATPRVRRRLSAFQCGLIAAMGAVLGTACGVLPAIGLRQAQAIRLSGLPGQQPTTAVISYPWSTLLVIALVLPLAAATTTALFTRSRIALIRHD